jgi:predicted nucleic acid-binding protein
MIILDTNIVSELMKTSPTKAVLEWLDQQSIMDLFLTSITIAEISYGLSILSKGSRRHSLEEIFHKAIIETFQYRILSFDESAAHVYGKIMANRKKQGRPMSMADGQIAAIASVHRACIATRNTSDFLNCELNLVDPFLSILLP